MADEKPDRYRTQAPSKTYKDNYAEIFGRTGPAESTEEDRESWLEASKERHARLVAEGKKDAQYYLDHEVRVAENPDFRASPSSSPTYRKNWGKIFGK